MLISRVNDPNIVNISQQVGPYNTGIHIDEIITNFGRADLKKQAKQPTLLTGMAFLNRYTSRYQIYKRRLFYVKCARVFAESGWAYGNGSKRRHLLRNR